MLDWAHSSEDKEESEGESLGESREVESYRGEGEGKEDNKVLLAALGQGVRRRGWRILDHGI